MSYLQFAQELKHLEYIVPSLTRDSPLGLVYWRGRVASLSIHRDLTRDEIPRVTRLINLLASEQHGGR